MSAVERVAAAYARNAAVNRPEIWITLRDRDDVLAEAERIDAGPALSLSGTVIAVKDNIDVAGTPTTAACPAFRSWPRRDSVAVARLRAAGAIVLGKTNLDQFATGLVGTRSSHGAVRDARREDYISGGSSSGSAVAVALEIADLGVGTDTAGSGRVPAAFQGLVGVKPTRGLIPTGGVLPACRTLDCVSLFARSVGEAHAARWLMSKPDPAEHDNDSQGRGWPDDAPPAAPHTARIAVPDAAQLTNLTEDARRAFAAALTRLADTGADLVTIDLGPFLEAGQLLYGGAFVADRDAAFGGFVRSHPTDVDPSVRSIIDRAGGLSARDLAADQATRDALRVTCARSLLGCDALVLPTAPRQPTIAEVASDPLAANAALGCFTTFANLLDMCAYAVPAGAADGGCFGISLLAPAFADRVIEDLAAVFLSEPLPGIVDAEPQGTSLFVIGAHRQGEPLNRQLTEAGARFRRVAMTRPGYRMFALDTDPAKPVLVRDGAALSAIEGELWDLPPARLGPFLSALPQPMALGRVSLEGDHQTVGFLCEPAALAGAADISDSGSWLRYRHGSTRDVAAL